jgi:Winged helix-turn-helix DNA-binding
MPLVEVLTEVPDDAAEAAPTRSVRRATARRASRRRATARRRQGDLKASIIEFLAQHAGSTAGELAKGLNLNPGKVSTRLTQLAKTGKIKKTSHGYSTQQTAPPRRHQPHSVAHPEPAGTRRRPRTEPG